MSLAKKCDICGRYYDNYGTGLNGTNGVAFVSLDVDQRPKIKRCYDSCPTCLEKILNFTTDLSEEKNHD